MYIAYGLRESDSEYKLIRKRSIDGGERGGRSMCSAITSIGIKCYLFLHLSVENIVDSPEKRKLQKRINTLA